jgi:hypothetical protein
MIARSRDLGGLIRENGELDRPLPFDGNYIPTAIDVDSKYLYYALGRGALSKVPVSPDVLKDFLRLASASAEDIAAFARKYGILTLCSKHRLPIWHTESADGSGRKICLPAGIDQEGRTIIFRDFPFGIGKEPLKSWRNFAVQATGIMNIAAALRNGNLGSTKDWKNADPDWEVRRSEYLSNPDKWLLHLDQIHLENLIASWLRGNVAPKFIWGSYRERSESENINFYFTERAPSITLSGCLLGMLGLKLAMAIASSEGYYKCAGCPEWFFTKRRRNPSRNKYCDSCGRTAANREAQRRRRSKAKS